MKNGLKKTERYFATITFKDGKSADVRSGNLKKLLARIKRGFAGETTDWGMANASGVAAFEVEDQWSDSVSRGGRIVASQEAA